MLSYYEILKSRRTGISHDLWTMLAAQKFGSEYQHTTEADYIYSNDTIIYYTGEKYRPEIPHTFNDIQVRVIEMTAFTGQDIRAVKIPDGTEVIK